MKIYVVDENDYETTGQVIDSDYSGYDQLVITKDTIDAKSIDIPFSLYQTLLSNGDETLSTNEKILAVLCVRDGKE